MKKALVEDSHRSQAKRTADFLEAFPNSTLNEITAGADVASASKIVSAMQLEFGYRLEKSTRQVVCSRGTRFRFVRIYRLISRPACDAGAEIQLHLTL
jgi:hypothetical protein